MNATRAALTVVLVFGIFMGASSPWVAQRTPRFLFPTLARIRTLMAAGALPSEPPVISGTGDVGAVKNPLPAACSVCGERAPQITPM